MAIVYVNNKKNGVTYVYESTDYWDKEKKQSRSKRVCIGKLDPATGEIIPSKRLTSESKENFKPGPVPFLQAKHLYCGATYLFDKISDKLDITDDLRKCFPDSYKKIQSIAYYLILEDSNPLYRFSKWAAIHKHPYGKDIPSQRSSEFFSSISEDDRERFFRLQGRRRAERKYWAYDITSLSTYSECLQQARYGVNKEQDILEQINLALLFGEQSGIPFYYRKLPGNISDVNTVRNLLSDIDFLEYKKIKLVMDRGFYSEENINNMYHHHLKFLIGAKTTLKYVKAAIDKARSTIGNWKHFDPNHNLYISTSSISWKYSKQRPYKGDTVNGDRRAYLHIYFDKERETAESRKFSMFLLKLKEELESGKTTQEHDSQYRKYFEVISTPKRGVKVLPKQDAIDETVKNHGYFALLSNDVKDPAEALALYRSKDLVEKTFGNLKERLTMEVSSELSLDGKLFVEFIALIILSYLKKMMQENNLFRKYTILSILDEFDVIDCYEQPGCDLRFGEITNRQKELYTLFGITPPSSL
mgnify:CR=1 FL=1